jgi:hypothetical protein
MVVNCFGVASLDEKIDKLFVHKIDIEDTKIVT